jgi:mRNA interferase RelE/StbE
MYNIDIDKKALKELKLFPKADQEKILKKIDSLKDNPRPMGYEPLHGKLADYYRIRFGDYRIVYEIFNDKLFIVVVKIAGRGQVYKKK